MDVTQLSRRFPVRNLKEPDVDAIYELSHGHELFYQYHPPLVTKASIREDMRALPPGKGMQDKYYVGFFRGDALLALLDLILDYPAKGTAHIGLFMLHPREQGRGLGSELFREIAAYLQSLGYAAIRIGVDFGNPQSLAFWEKQGFRAVSKGDYLVMELAL